MNSSKISRISILVASIGVFLSVEAHAGWVKGVARAPGANVRKQGINTAEILGTFPAGSPFTIFAPARNGYYAIYFGKKWKNIDYGWVSVNEVDVATPMAQSSGSSSSYSRSSRNLASKKFVVRAGANFLMLNPSTFQVAVGDLSSTFLNVGIQGEVEYRSGFISDKVAGSLDFNWYSFQQASTLVANSSIYEFANGFSFIPRISYYLYEKNGFNVAASAGLGISINSVGNSTGSQLITTTAIIGVPIVFQVMIEDVFVGMLGGFIKLGYKIESLSNVPGLLISTGSATVGNFSLSAPFGTVGLSYRF